MKSAKLPAPRQFGGKTEVGNISPLRPGLKYPPVAIHRVSQILAPVLAAHDSLKVGQNLKFDEWILSRHGMPLRGPRFDTMVASYVTDPGRRSHGLDDLDWPTNGVSSGPHLRGQGGLTALSQHSL